VQERRIIEAANLNNFYDHHFSPLLVGQKQYREKE